MGTYLSIVSGAIKLLSYLASALQQHHDELNGVTAQREATSDATTKELEAVGAPVSTTQSDQLWAANKARYSPDSGKTGS